MFSRLIAAAAICASALPAFADMGALTRVLPGTGTDGTWTTAQAGGAFAIANPSEDGALRYYYLNTAPGHDKVASVTVELADGDPQGFAGIIFSFDTSDKHYHVFAVQNDGAYAVFKRDESGFNKMVTSLSDGPVRGPQVLTIEEEGDQVTYAVNGNRLGAIGAVGLGDGGIGIVVGRIVSATFSDFKISDATN